MKWTACFASGQTSGSAVSVARLHLVGSTFLEQVKYIIHITYYDIPSYSIISYNCLIHNKTRARPTQLCLLYYYVYVLYYIECYYYYIYSRYYIVCTLLLLARAGPTQVPPGAHGSARGEPASVPALARQNSYYH